MDITLDQQHVITSCIDSIFSSKTESSILDLMQKTISELKTSNFFIDLPSAYEDITIKNIEDALSCYKEMKCGNFEEGRLKELYGLFSAVNLRVDELNR